MDGYTYKKLKNNSKEKNSPFFYKYALKFLVLIIFTLITLIFLKSNSSFRTRFYHEIYDSHFSFATVNKIYQNAFGNPLPFKDLFKDNLETVFNEKIRYKVASKYYDGVSLEVENNLIIPALESGMVVFVGEKENYGSTIIIEQIDGVDVWYGNVTNLNVKLYDYVDKGYVLGNSNNNTLYLVYKKDGKNLDYEKYL